MIYVPEDVQKIVDDIMAEVLANGWDWSTEQCMARAILSERERCSQIAMSEPELEGEPTQFQLQMMASVGPIDNARSAVKATKKAINRRIQNLQSRRPGCRWRPER